MELRKTAHGVYLSIWHLVLVTKYRKSWLKGAAESVAVEALIHSCNRLEAKTMEINGGNNHIHLLIDAPIWLSPLAMVKFIKEESSIRIWGKIDYSITDHYKAGQDVWSDGFCILSKGEGSAEVAAKYIRDQKLK